MQINNFIQINNWEPKKFFRMIIGIQLVMLGFTGLDFIGIQIPILRQFVGFVFLTFVPGIIILRLLNLHGLSNVVNFLLSAGLSISFLMFSGFFLNSILPFFKIDHPISFYNIYIFIIILFNVLFILSIKIDKSYRDILPAPLKISRSALYLMLLPVLSIVGTYLVNFHKNNIVLLILIVLIALIPIFVALKKINPELYPLALFVIAISLLLHRSLISMNLPGFDINAEYHFYRLVSDNAYWNPTNYSNINAMLSIVILPTVYSYILKMDGIWVFKIVFPIIFSMVPLGLYYIYKTQLRSDIESFFSVFFFMSFFTFFTEMLALIRQEIAEFFLVLLLIIMFQDNINKSIRNILLVIFGASLIVSHYGLSYIYMFFIIFIYLLSLGIMISKTKSLNLPKFNLTTTTLKYFVAFYIIFALFWYVNFSSSSVFNSIVRIGDQLYSNIFNEFLNLENRDKNLLRGLGLADPIVLSFQRQIHRALQFITQFFIIIGFFKIIVYREFTRFKAEYFYLSIASILFLLLSILPNFATSFNMTRIYHIMLILLSPLFIIGGKFVIDNLIKKINFENTLNKNYTIFILISGILVPYFLFNAGLIYEMTNDIPNSLPLGMERMEKDDFTKISFYGAYIPEQDVYSANWYNMKKNEKEIIYADRDSKLGVLYSYGMILGSTVKSPFLGNSLNTYIYKKYYVYLRKLNVCNDKFVVSNRITISTSVISPLLDNSSKIYSDGCGEIYKK